MIEVEKRRRCGVVEKMRTTAVLRFYRLVAGRLSATEPPLELLDAEAFERRVGLELLDVLAAERRPKALLEVGVHSLPFCLRRGHALGLGRLLRGHLTGRRRLQIGRAHV